ncbi:uncharacterized protein LOC130196043 [Pseudoliparis swirei]|uniref:uncharacterized protein LOC130196043 n=1 Tax=Pseudoliparis swirei TaxID=2059687 RepID=UPI0024BD9179|nr:uncharacterized protein LOC130196043 [Pseudoliparis swirei]
MERLHTPRRRPGQETQRSGPRRTPGDEPQGDGGAGGVKEAKRAEAGGDGDVVPRRVPVDAAPYLSIGTNQNRPGPDDAYKQSAEASGQRSRTGRAMKRISTWPPAAVQWWARCEAEQEEEEEEEEEGFAAVAVWTFAGGGGRTLYRRRSGPPVLRTPRTTHQTKILDKTTATHTLNEETLCPDPDLNPAASPAQKTSGEGGGGGTSTGPQAPPPSGGGAASSSDDETLLSDNEDAVMDLLHEVAQNNGRWTRTRGPKNPRAAALRS